MCKNAYVPLFMCATASLYKASEYKDFFLQKKMCVSVCAGVCAQKFFVHKPLCVRISACKSCSVQRFPRPQRQKKMKQKNPKSNA